MAQTLKSTYTRAVKQEHMPAELQLGVLAWCRSTGNDELFAALVSRQDACDAVLDAARKSSSFRVLGAYLSRPEVTADELTRFVKREKRVAVLSAIASAEHVPVTLLEQLSFDRRLGVGVALLANPRTPKEARCRVITRLAGSYTSLSYANQKILDDAVEATPEIHETLAADPAISMKLLVRLLGHGALSDGTVVAIIDRVVTEPANAALTSPDPSNADVIARNALTLFNAITAPAPLHHLLDVVRSRVMRLPMATWTRNNLTNCLTRFKDVDEVAALTADADSSSDPVRLVEVARAAVTRNDYPLIGRLVRNPHLPVEAIEVLMGGSVSASLRPAVERHRDAHLRARYCLHTPSEITEDLIPDDELGRKVLDQIVDALAANGGDRYGQIVANRLLRLSWVDASLVDRLPAPVVLQGADLWPEAAHGYVVARLAELCGTAESRWQMLHSLADSFSGSFSELLEACEALDSIAT